MLVLVGVGLQVAPSPGERPSALGPLATTEMRVVLEVTLRVAPLPDPPPAGVSSAIFFVPGFLLLVPGGAAMRVREGRGFAGGAGPREGRGRALTGPAHSLPRDLHLLRRPRQPGLPVLLPALLREVSAATLHRDGDDRAPISRDQTPGPPGSPLRKFGALPCPLCLHSLSSQGGGRGGALLQ